MKLTRKILTTTLTSSLIMILLFSATIGVSRFMLSLKELSNQTITILAYWNTLDRITNDVLYYRLDSVTRLAKLEESWLEATENLDDAFFALKRNRLLRILPPEIDGDIDKAWYVWQFSKNKLIHGQIIFHNLLNGERATQVLYELDKTFFFQKLQSLIEGAESYEERRVYQSFLAQMFVLDITSDSFSQLLESINLRIPGQINTYIFYLLFFVSLSLALVVLVSLYSIYKVMQPINRLARTVQEMSELDNPARIETAVVPGIENEVSMIHSAFNRMAERIHGLYEDSLYKERETRKAQFRALQYQINPHFLYNTLGSLRMSAALRGESETADSIQSLSRLLRNTITRSEGLISLSEELEIMQDYIAVIQVRYRNRLVYRVSLEDEFLGDYQVPALILQPLLENAVLHGLTGKLNTGTEEALLEISGTRDGDILRLSVLDNGKGISPDRLPLIMENSPREEGEKEVCIGLRNIHDRIVLLFGDSYGLSLASREGEFTRVDVCLPLLEGEGDAAAFNS